MKIHHIIENAESWSKIAKDPRASKLISIAFKQDHSIPLSAVARAGINPTDDKIVTIFGQLVDKVLSNTKFGDISRDGKFDDWIARKYMEGHFDYEDLSGQAADALGAWKALSIRGLLKPEHQDFSRFMNLKKLQSIVMQNQFYRDNLRRIEDSERIEQAKREQKSITLIDNDRFLVSILLNYGACYVFNNKEGVQATFCTGSSSGQRWFEQYKESGIIIAVLDKNNIDNIEGKWQIHAPTHQLKLANQSGDRYSSERKFKQLFPTLGSEILSAIEDKRDQIYSAGYDVEKDVENLKRAFPTVFGTESSGS